MTAPARPAVLLVSHGSVDDLDDLGAFLTTVRRGRPAPPGLVVEVRRRYEAIGGSPLNAVNRTLAEKLAAKLGGDLVVEVANRLWRPFTRDAIAALAERGVRRAVVVPLAQHSAHVYALDAVKAAEGSSVAVTCAPSWGGRADLSAAFVTRIAAKLKASPDRARTTVLMTAHSLPKSVIDAGDPYEEDFRASADAVAAALRACGLVTSREGDGGAHADVAFQSQGLEGHGAWLGPDLAQALGDAKARGDRHVVIAPVGFLADHVEILYDLDVEARRMAEDRGLSYARAASLNAADDFVAILEAVARPLLHAEGAGG
jgi:ferrochelatase